MADTLIGILVIDRPITTERCLKHLFQNTKRSDYELVVVDNNSNEKTKELLWKYNKEIDFLITNPFNTGCALGLNQYLACRSPNQDVVNLNADVFILVDDWLPTLRKVTSYDDIGTASGRRPTFWYDQGRFEYLKKYVTIEERNNIFIEDAEIMIFPFILIRQEVLNTIGFINEAINIDDLDYCARVRALGLKTVYVPDVVCLQTHEEKQEHPQYGANRDLVIKHWTEHQNLRKNFVPGFAYYCGTRFKEGTIGDNIEYQKMSDENWEFFKNYDQTVGTR